MNNHQMIIEQIRRMRSKQVEPESVIVSDDIYESLGCPERIIGVVVECDRKMKGFEVR